MGLNDEFITSELYSLSPSSQQASSLDNRPGCALDDQQEYILQFSFQMATSAANSYLCRAGAKKILQKAWQRMATGRYANTKHKNIKVSRRPA
jgi:hypothetical protein